MRRNRRTPQIQAAAPLVVIRLEAAHVLKISPRHQLCTRRAPNDRWRGTVGVAFSMTWIRTGL